MSLATPTFWSYESIPAEVMAISAPLHPNMETFTISPQSSILTQISLFDLWTCYSRSHLSNKTITTFLPFLVPDVQSNVPMTQL